MWEVDLDRWMAAPGGTLFRPEVGARFYFETDFNGRRYPHYGRFLDLKPDGTGTHARLTQAGFLTDKAAREHEHAWHVGLRNLDALLSDT